MSGKLESGPDDARRRRLRFRSWHRGTRETDLLLGSFADRYVDLMTDAQLDSYEQLLEQSDPDLYQWIAGREPPPDSLQSDVLTLLIAHRFA